MKKNSSVKLESTMYHNTVETKKLFLNVHINNSLSHLQSSSLNTTTTTSDISLGRNSFELFTYSFDL
jgi:hypothetical protein